MQEPVYVLHLITCHGRIMPHLAELLFQNGARVFTASNCQCQCITTPTQNINDSVNKPAD